MSTAKQRVMPIALISCLLGGIALTAHDRPANLTYNRDIAPIIGKRCLGCHSSGGGAAPDLAGYANVLKSARLIRRSVIQRTMPPWPAASGFGDFGNDPTLTPVEIEMIDAWVEGKRSEGLIEATVSSGQPGTRPLDAPNHTAWAASLGPRPRSVLTHRALSCGQTALDSDIELVAITPTTAADTNIEVVAVSPGGASEPLLVIPRFDPRYQYRYDLRTPLRLSRGTAIVIGSSDRGCRADIDFIPQVRPKQ